MTCLTPGIRKTGVLPHNIVNVNECSFVKLIFDLKGGSGPAGLPQVPLKTGICAQNLGGTTQPLGERFYVKQPFDKE